MPRDSRRSRTPAVVDLGARQPPTGRPIKVLLGLCGVGATVASPQHILYLRERGFDVRVILSENAARFVSVDVIEAFSRHKSHASVFDKGDGISVPHVELPEWCDVFMIMPASANLISRMAHGAADDLVSTCVLHCDAPVLVVPALNPTVLRKGAVVRNLRTLKRDGLHVLGPVAGPSIRVARADRVAIALPSLDEVVRYVHRLLGTRVQRRA